MDDWKRRGIEMIPSLESEISSAETPEDLWTELAQWVDVLREEADSEDVLSQIFRFAHECLQTSPDEMLFRTVVRDFFGEIISSKVWRKELAARISKDIFPTLMDELTWRLDNAKIEQIEKEFWEAKNKWLRKRGGRDVY